MFENSHHIHQCLLLHSHHRHPPEGSSEYQKYNDRQHNLEYHLSLLCYELLSSNSVERACEIMIHSYTTYFIRLSKIEIYDKIL